MAYVNPNFKTKKALKDALKEGKDIEVYQAGPFGPEVKANGTVCIEGPHYPQPHTWYAEGTMENGKLVKVK